jgi:hypothetical protein
VSWGVLISKNVFLMVILQGKSLYSSPNDMFLILNSLRGYLKCLYDVIRDVALTGQQYDFVTLAILATKV